MTAFDTRTDKHTLTRGQVAKELGISVSSVRRMEHHHLHPVLGDDGVWRFDPAELEGMKKKAARPRQKDDQAIAFEERTRKRRGEIAARVFRMFASYRTLPEIVIATRQSPEVIRDLYREWSTSLEDRAWEERRGR